MASPDFYVYAAQQRMAEIEAQRAQSLADLAQYRATNDYQSAGQAVQEIANLDAQRQALVNLHSQYVESQRVPEPPELTPEEKAAKPISAMDYGDVWEMSATSKYGVDENLFRAGMAEVARRRAKGE